MATTPYQAGDSITAEYPSQWGTLSGKGTVLTCEPSGQANRWTVTARIGSEERGEAVTVTYTVNSNGNSTTGRYARRTN
jgi:hypothetical protein